MKIHLSSSAKALLAITILGVGVRLALAASWGDRLELTSGVFDQLSYDTLGQRVATGHGFSFPSDWYPSTRANAPTSFWSFGYVSYLAAVYSVFGHHPFAARLIQVLLSGANCLLIYRIGRRLFDERSGVAAAALTAAYAYLIFFNAALMTQTFYILTLLLAVDQALQLTEKPAWRNWLLLGASLGIGALLRQTLLLFMPILSLFLWWRLPHNLPSEGERRLRLGMLTPYLVVGLLVLPWTIRNYAVFHDFLLLNSNSGFWFYSSNSPGQGVDFNQNYVAPIPPQLLELAEPARDREMLREAVGFIATDPTRFLELTASRIKVFYWVLPVDQSSLASNVARLFSFTLYLPFMLYGLYLSLRHWRACSLLYLYVAFDATLHLLSWSAPRYRLPSDAVMMVFAGLAAVSLAERVGLLPRRVNYHLLMHEATSREVRVLTE